MCRAAPGGGHLISIDSEEVQEFVKKQMEGENVEELWVGASRQTTDWRWVESEYNYKSSILFIIIIIVILMVIAFHFVFHILRSTRMHVIALQSVSSNEC